MSDHLIIFRIESLADSFFRKVLAPAVYSINIIILIVEYSCLVYCIIQTSVI